MSGLVFYSHVESMHDRIMSLRGMENNNSLTPPLFIEVLVPKKKGNERLCVILMGLPTQDLKEPKTFKQK